MCALGGEPRCEGRRQGVGGRGVREWTLPTPAGGTYPAEVCCEVRWELSNAIGRIVTTDAPQVWVIE